MGKNQENQNEYYKSLNAKIPLADMVVEEAYQNQIKIVEEQYEMMSKMPGIEAISFVRPVPRSGERLLRRNGFVIGLNEMYAGERSREFLDAEIYTKEQNDIYNSVEVCENPWGYTFGFSVKFPEGKNSIVIDSEKGESIPINSENLENKLREQGLKPSSVKKAQTKYNYEKREDQKETVYQVFFNYEAATFNSFGSVERIKSSFRTGIKEPLEEAINCIVNLELK